MNAPTDALTADRKFFDLLLAAKAEELEDLLADSFQLIAVGTGELVSKTEFVEALRSGLLRFHAIHHSDTQVHTFGDSAIVIGRTEMTVTMGTRWSKVKSRYTHMYVKQRDEWRMVSAQGTPIVEAA
jgi:hypothetical protein